MLISWYGIFAINFKQKQLVNAVLEFGGKKTPDFKK